MGGVTMNQDAAQSAGSATKDHSASRKFYETLIDSEWTSPVKLSGFQQETLERYILHAVRHVPYHRSRLSMLLNAKGAIDLRRWLDVPVMTRVEIERHHEALVPDEVPAEHGRVLRVQTSGSGGHPLTLRKSGLHNTALTCAFYRMGTAFGLDWRKDLLSIRAYDSIWRGPLNPVTSLDVWGPPWIAGEDGGKRCHMSVHTPVREQLDFIRAKAPAYINTSAHNAMALATEVAKSGDAPSEIIALLTVGEYVSDDLRRQCRTHLGCEIIDAFSTGECGTLVTQCPDSTNYHMQPELTVLEVLKPDGTPCRPGETGLMTSTPLYNYAMPLVRYQSEDLVTVGGQCSCGRPAPALSQLHGRSMHQFITADGSFLRPSPDSARLREFIGFRRWQLTQVEDAQVELRLVNRAGDRPADTNGAIDYVEGLLDGAMRVRVRHVPVLGPSSGGKFPPIIREWRHDDA